jgi:hypothetical protein
MSHDSRSTEERRILERWRSDPEEQAQLRKAVRTVLEHVFERHEEVPLVAMYRCALLRCEGGLVSLLLCVAAWLSEMACIVVELEPGGISPDGMPVPVTLSPSSSSLL